MERSTVLGCTTPCHLAQGGGVGGQLAAYFLLSLAVPNWRTLTASQVRNLATVGSPAAVLYYGY